MGFEERIARAAWTEGDDERAIEMAAIHDKRTGDDLAERMRRAQRRPQPPDGRHAGLTAKQAAILLVMMEAQYSGHQTGYSARDLESGLAESLHREIVGWSASDVRQSLGRMLQRGLVTRSRVSRTRLREPNWVWFPTTEGEERMNAWLDGAGY